MEQEIEITKEMVEIMIDRVKHGYFNPANCREFIIPFNDVCGVCINTPEILDLALQELKIKAQSKKLTAYFEDAATPKFDGKQKILLRVFPFDTK